MTDPYTPSPQFLREITWDFYLDFAQAKQYQHRIHIVYASCVTEYDFLQRSMDDIILEISGALANGKDKIVFWASAEPLFMEYVVKAQKVADHFDPVKPHTFFFTTCGLNSDREWAAMVAGLAPKNPLTIMITNYYGRLGKHNCIIPNYHYPIRRKLKKFTCLNRAHHLHRIQLLAKILDLGLLDQSFYSFQGLTPDWMDTVKWEGMDPSVGATILAHRHIFPLTVNITERRPNPIDIQLDDYRYHAESYFSVVTEGTYSRYSKFYMDCQLITEKTYRCISLKHPFIMLSFPGSLQVLRDLGYKTFEPWINESYDLEEDDDLRLEMVVKEIQRLCLYTDDQWLHWQQSIKPIVDHNLAHMLTTDDFAIRCDFAAWFYDAR